MPSNHETKIVVSSMSGTFDKDDDGLFQKKNQDLSLLLSKLSPYQWYSFEEQDQLLIMQGSVTGRFRDRYRYTYWQAESVKRAILDPLAKELNQLLSQDPFAPTFGMWQWPIIPTYKSVPVSSRLALVGHQAPELLTTLNHEYPQIVRPGRYTWETKIDPFGQRYLDQTKHLGYYIFRSNGLEWHYATYGDKTVSSPQDDGPFYTKFNRNRK